MQKIYKKGKNLIIEVSLKTVRSNPYNEDYHAEMDNIIGLIQSEYEMGLCFRIDMEYKDKGDQWTDYFFKWHGEQKDFEKLCKEMKFSIIYDWKNQTCTTCGKIYDNVLSDICGSCFELG